MRHLAPLVDLDDDDLRLLPLLDGASVGRVSSREPTLEDAYVALVTQE